MNTRTLPTIIVTILLLSFVSTATTPPAISPPKIAEMPNENDCSNLSTINKARIGVFKEDMEKTLEQARSFTPSRGWYVQDFNDSRNVYLRAAISASERKEFVENKGDLAQCLEGLLDQISAAAKETLPKYTMTGFNVRNPAEEKLIRSQVNDLTQATVFKVGLGGATWNIQKNNIGIPEKRYKHGAIWAKYPTSVTDDGYCRIIYVNVLQEYAGGGTWGSSYGLFIKSEPAGCPPGK